MLDTLQSDLNRWGPDASPAEPVSLEQARQYTKRVALGHYENFPVVSLCLPAHLRQPFYDVYAFCRWADDLGDEIDSTEESLRLLAWWRNELEGCYAGQPKHPVFVALEDTVREFQLSERHFQNLISAFEQDQQQTRYSTREELVDYCTRSANPVGRILLELSKADSERNLLLSDDVCTGLQLINFWQDVARDFEIDRVYLPQADMQQHGVTEQDLQSGIATGPFRTLLKEEVDWAECLLLSGRELALSIPASIRFDIRLFSLGGLKICEKIRKQQYDTLSSRPKLKKHDLPALFWHAWRGRFKTG